MVSPGNVYIRLTREEIDDSVQAWATIAKIAGDDQFVNREIAHRVGDGAQDLDLLSGAEIGGEQGRKVLFRFLAIGGPKELGQNSGMGPIENPLDIAFRILCLQYAKDPQERRQEFIEEPAALVRVVEVLRCEGFARIIEQREHLVPVGFFESVKMAIHQRSQAT
jgi:hypothetical protein